jgi:hypothetical protein
MRGIFISANERGVLTIAIMISFQTEEVHDIIPLDDVTGSATLKGSSADPLAAALRPSERFRPWNACIYRCV